MWSSGAVSVGSVFGECSACDVQGWACAERCTCKHVNCEVVGEGVCALSREATLVDSFHTWAVLLSHSM
jgi:hypothetical protein